MEKLAAVLISAHAISDFFLQTDTLAKKKSELGYLILHAAIHAMITYLVLQSWACWQAPLFVFIVHGLIDFVKQRLGRETATAFVVDQTIHVLSLLLLAYILVRMWWLPWFDGVGYKQLIVLAGLAATVQGAGFLVGCVTKRLVEKNDLTMEGLCNGGKLIGQLERSLIYLFILTSQPAAIGFLVAAKSVFRFEEAKDQKMAEYILIGTLLSFTLAVTLAYSFRWALNL